MTREQKLEAALRALYEETSNYIRINNLGDVHHNQSMQMAHDALATPPPSEWNEAIEAAAQMVGCSNGSVPYLVYSIRTLKRKEQS